MYKQLKQIIKILMPYSILQFYRKYLRFKKTRKLLRFDIHLTDHCNLNCASCDHFSPLAEEKFMDINIFEKDCIQLNKLTGGIIENIAILGGEPLLHPLINKFMEISRKYFPVGRIQIDTNGILLEKQPESFWLACSENEIDIFITIYPIKINHSLIKKKADKYGVKLYYRGNPLIMKTDKWRKIKIDLNGKQNSIVSNNLCFAGNYCFQLIDGRLYKCWRVAYIKYFNNIFNENLEVTENDYIDIYSVNNFKEILRKIKKPIPFCRYCNLEEKEYITWQKSRKEISEWT